jgi:hypothetical protein
MATGTYSAKVGAGGTATVTVRTPSREAWVISQVSTELPSAPSGASSDIRLNGNLVTVMVPSGDAASGDPPITLLDTDTLTVNWGSCTPNTVAKVLVFYEPRRNR